MFDNPDTDEKEVEAISAVKALQLASEQGQEILTITQENYSEAIKKINLSGDVREDIHNAINAGKQVTTHTTNVSYKGWNGAGYIILDTDYGTGAYLISGGANGAVVYSLGVATSVAILGFITIFLATIAPTAAVAGSITVGAVGMSVILTQIIAELLLIYNVLMDQINRIADNEEEAAFFRGCFFKGLLGGTMISKPVQGSIIVAIVGKVVSLPTVNECFGFKIAP